MTQLKLPSGAEAGFRLECWDAFGNRFTANIYGKGRGGWILGMRKSFGNVTSVGPQPLARGKWREFLGLVKQANFWELPKTLPIDSEVATDDGEWLTFVGRVGERFHEVHRDGCGGRGLFQIQRFLTRLSGLFPDPRPAHPTEGAALDVAPFDPGAATTATCHPPPSSPSA